MSWRRRTFRPNMRQDVWIVPFGRWDELRKRLAAARLGTRKLVRTDLGEREVAYLFGEGVPVQHQNEPVRGMVDLVRAGYYLAEVPGGRMAVVGRKSALMEVLRDALASSVLGS